MPGFGNIDPAVLDDVPPNTVLAQVVLDQGLLRGNSAKCVDRVLPPVPHRDAITKTLSCEVIVDIVGLSGVEIVASALDPGGPNASWGLVGSDGETVTVTVANLCDENPLRLKTVFDPLPNDEDCRWISKLLIDDDQQRLLDSLGGLSFPVPLTPVGKRNGQGLNCSPVVVKPIKGS